MSDPKKPTEQKESRTPFEIHVGDLVEPTSPALGTVVLRYDWIYLVVAETYISGSDALMILGPDGEVKTIRSHRVHRVWRPLSKISIFRQDNE
jgi:hypothetical protein